MVIESHKRSPGHADFKTVGHRCLRAPLFQRKDDADEYLAPTYYGWTIGDHWTAATDLDPRFAFAGNPYLYKVQVTTLVPTGSAHLETDPCQEFLADFVTAVEPFLVRKGE